MSECYLPPNLAIRDLTCTELNLHFGSLQASIAVAVHVLNHCTGGQALGGAILISSIMILCMFSERLAKFYQVSMADAKKKPCKKKRPLVIPAHGSRINLYLLF